MKSRYGFWKHWLTSLTGLAGLVCLLGLTGCKELTCDFTWSPDTPAAGTSVAFDNNSTGADDYYWTFGDNGTSTNTNPYHTYLKPGTYTVSLTIVRNKVEKRSRTQYITIIDSIPTIVCDSDSIYSFTPIKFTPAIYNPWDKPLTYHWTLPEDATILAGKGLDSSAVVCFFNQSDTSTLVKLDVQMGDLEPFHLKYEFTPHHQQGRSLLFINNTQAMEQFTYMVNKHREYEAAQPTTSAENIALLMAEQDTVYWYGERKYTIGLIAGFMQHSIQGFQIDRLGAKIYAYGDGLWVCNITGINPRQLLNTPVQAIKVDGDNNRLYWATNQGIYVQRLFGTITNQDSFEPELVSNYPAIQRISVNSNLH